MPPEPSRTTSGWLASLFGGTRPARGRSSSPRPNPEVASAAGEEPGTLSAAATARREALARRSTPAPAPRQPRPDRRRDPKRPRPALTPPTSREPTPERPPGPPPVEPEPRRRPFRRRRARARKVHRVVRHVDPWSVLKVSVLFYLALFLIVLVASTILWSIGRQAGGIESAEDLISELFVYGECPPDADAPDTDGPTPVFGEPAPDGDDGIEDRRRRIAACPDEDLINTFQFDGEKLFRALLLGGLVLVVAGAIFNVVLAILFNLISDMTGGVRVTVLEEQAPVAAGRGARRVRRG